MAVEKELGKGEEEVTPPDKAQKNFTDPDSRIMPATGGKHFIQAYNAQAAVDSANQVIVAAEVTNKPTDRGQSEGVLDNLTEQNISVVSG